jgi:hypothetical protein
LGSFQARGEPEDDLRTLNVKGKRQLYTASEGEKSGKVNENRIPTPLSIRGARFEMDIESLMDFFGKGKEKEVRLS